MKINQIFGEPRGAASDRVAPKAAQATRQSLSTGLFGIKSYPEGRKPADPAKGPEQLPRGFH